MILTDPLELGSGAKAPSLDPEWCSKPWALTRATSRQPHLGTNLQIAPPGNAPNLQTFTEQLLKQLQELLQELLLEPLLEQTQLSNQLLKQLINMY